MLRLLEEWGDDARSWRILRLLLGDKPYTDEHRKFCRSELLQIGCASFDHYELRMRHPPYTLIKTLDLLRFHKRLALLTSTIEDAAVDILHFLIIMALFVFGCARASRRARRGRRG